MKNILVLGVAISALTYFLMSPVTAQPPQCAPMADTMPACQNGRVITINNQSKTIMPRNLCMDAGDTVTFNVRPNGTSASVSPKNGAWPSDGGTSFQLVVPGGQPYYDYNVHFEDGTCVDPRITVKSD